MRETPQQADLPIQHFAETILLLDGDEAGVRATAKLRAGFPA